MRADKTHFILEASLDAYEGREAAREPALERAHPAGFQLEDPPASHASRALGRPPRRVNRLEFASGAGFAILRSANLPSGKSDGEDPRGRKMKLGLFLIAASAVI